MAITFIKLGPIGDAFSSKVLGLYLLPGTASQIDSTILTSTLINFLLTGFIVEISIGEYDNIKLNNYNTTNIPLNSIPIGQPNILEPVNDVVTSPPSNNIGVRYLIQSPVAGPFSAYRDYIAESSGVDWEYTKPVNGMILPVYSWGISLHYSGTYPSGKWDIPADKLALITIGVPVDDQLTDLLNQLKKEIQNRIDGDNILQIEIDNIHFPSVKAADVSVEDSNNYYTSNNVEGALSEIGLRLHDDDVSIAAILAELGELSGSGITFQFLVGTGIPDVSLGNNHNIYLDTEGRALYKKTGTSDEDATWGLIFKFGVDPEINSIPTGTPIPIILDFTTDPLNTYGNNPSLEFREKLSATTSKPRTDIDTLWTWDNGDHNILLSIQVNLMNDGSVSTENNLEYIIKPTQI